MMRKKKKKKTESSCIKIHSFLPIMVVSLVQHHQLEVLARCQGMVLIAGIDIQEG